MFSSVKSCSRSRPPCQSMMKWPSWPSKWLVHGPCRSRPARACVGACACAGPPFLSLASREKKVIHQKELRLHFHDIPATDRPTRLGQPAPPGSESSVDQHGLRIVQITNPNAPAGSNSRLCRQTRPSQDPEPFATDDLITARFDTMV